MLNIFKRNYLFSSGVLLLAICLGSSAIAQGPYLNSAHGNQAGTVAGVDRSSTSALGYAQGNCAHCHEQHGTIEGVEPDSPPLPSGPDNYALFYTNFINQTDGLCFKCHVDIGSLQSGGSLLNYSYSRQAGGWGPDTVDDILEMFSFYPSSGIPTYYPSSHNLGNIATFIDNNAFGWGYSANPNPCTACHNPHAAQKDNKTGARGWPLSLPSEHTNTPWDLWGNAPGELMNAYAPVPTYQAPYYFGGVGTNYEPDNSATIDGSNLVDTVTFCLDCHSNPITVADSSTLGAIPAINWAADVHGAGLARDATHNKGTVNLPYNDASPTDYVLSCLDCHEPHGSPNAYLLRSEVNGVQITPIPPNLPPPTPAQVITANNSTGNWATFCGACHTVTAVAVGNPCNNTTNHSSYAAAGNCISCHGHGQTFCGPGSGGTTKTF